MWIFNVGYCHARTGDLARDGWDSCSGELQEKSGCGRCSVEVVTNGEIRPWDGAIRIRERKVRAPDASAESIEQLVAGHPDAIRIAAEAGQRRDAVLQIQLVDDPGTPLRSRWQSHHRGHQRPGHLRGVIQEVCAPIDAVLTKGLRDNDQVSDGMTHSGNQDRAAHVCCVLSHAHTEADLAIFAGVFQCEGRIGRDRGRDRRNLGITAKNRKEKASLLLLSHIAIAVYAERGADLVCGLAKLKLPKAKVCVFQWVSP